MNEPLLAEFDLDPPSLSLSQMEEQEYFVHSYDVNVTSKHAEEKLSKVATVEGVVVEGRGHGAERRAVRSQLHQAGHRNLPR